MADYLKRLLLLPLLLNVCFYCLPVTTNAQTNTQLVMNVTVVTREGAFIDGLSRDDFSVEVDKLPQEIVSFSHAEAPASVGILIDTSGSYDPGKPYRPSLKQNLKSGLEQFVKLSHPANEYFVMTFNRSSALVQDWTRDPVFVGNTVDSLEFKGSTSMYDAILNAIPKVTSGQHSKRVLMVVSDGMDNLSKASSKKALEALKRSDVIFYAVGVLRSSRDGVIPAGVDEGSSILQKFARHTGGRVLLANLSTSPATFNDPFEYMAHELNSHYQLVINAEKPAGKEKWRKLRINVSKTDSSGKPQKLYAIAREGYYHP